MSFIQTIKNLFKRKQTHHSPFPEVGQQWFEKNGLNDSMPIVITVEKVEKNKVYYSSNFSKQTVFSHVEVFRNKYVTEIK